MDYANLYIFSETTDSLEESDSKIGPFTNEFGSFVSSENSNFVK